MTGRIRSVGRRQQVNTIWKPEDIKELRLGLGLTQKQLAIECQTTKRRIGGLEQGRWKPTRKILGHLQRLEAGSLVSDKARYQLHPEKHRKYVISPQRIQEFREKMGWSRDELRRRLGVVSSVRIWKWEHGDSVPTGVYLERLLALIKQQGLSA